MRNGLLWVSCMTGKLEDMHSISTSVFENPHCRKRAQNTKLICHYCFAEATLARYGSLAKHLKDNTDTLTSHILEGNEIPFIIDAIFRFEAFGDLCNMIQVINYFVICNANKRTQFTLWTKNPWFIKQAIEAGYDKPENLIIIYSSPCLNKEADYIFNRFDFIDGIFTVYTMEYALENNIDINCGNAKCKHCMRCYTKRDGKFRIHEIRKSDSKKYYKELEKRNANRG